MTKTLYLLRGTSGSGKTSLAKVLAKNFMSAVAHYEADLYFIEMDYEKGWVYNFNPAKLGAAHQWCQDLCKESMSHGETVIVSNTFTTEKEMKPYLDLAEDYGYHVVSLVVENRHGGKNTHGVPPETVERQASRLKNNLKFY